MKVESFLPPGSFVGLRLEDALEVSWCEELRGELQRRGFAATGAGYPRAYRSNDRLVFDDALLAARMFARLGPSLPAELMIEGERWQLAGFNPRLRACRYRGGQAFCVHRDGPYQPDDETRSWLTVQLYLDDAAQMSGGRTRFYADRDGRRQWAAVEPRRGTVIVFDHRVWHDGEAVSEGEKQVLRTDAVYRRVAPRQEAGPAAAGAAAGAEQAERDDLAAGGRVIGRHRGYVWRVISKGDGELVSSGRDGTVRRWRQGRELARYQVAASSVTALASARDGRLWCGTRGGAVCVVEREAGAVRTVSEGLGAVLDAAALPSGGVVVVTSLGEVITFDHDGRIAQRRPAHRGWAWAVASGVGEGDGVLSAGEDGEICADGRRLASLGVPVRALAALGDGGLLAGCADGQVIRIGAGASSFASSQPSRRAGGRRELIRAHTAAVTAFAVSADGRRWASASEDGTVALWGGGRGAERLWQAPPRGDFLTSVAFAADGSLIATGYDGCIVQWPSSASRR